MLRPPGLCLTGFSIFSNDPESSMLLSSPFLGSSFIPESTLTSTTVSFFYIEGIS